MEHVYKNNFGPLVALDGHNLQTGVIHMAFFASWPTLLVGQDDEARALPLWIADGFQDIHRHVCPHLFGQCLLRSMNCAPFANTSGGVDPTPKKEKFAGPANQKPLPPLSMKFALGLQCKPRGRSNVDCNPAWIPLRRKDNILKNGFANIDLGTT